MKSNAVYEPLLHRVSEQHAVGQPRCARTTPWPRTHIGRGPRCSIFSILSIPMSRVLVTARDRHHAAITAYRVCATPQRLQAIQSYVCCNVPPHQPSEIAAVRRACRNETTVHWGSRCSSSSSSTPGAGPDRHHPRSVECLAWHPSRNLRSNYGCKYILRF